MDDDSATRRPLALWVHDAPVSISTNILIFTNCVPSIAHLLTTLLPSGGHAGQWMWVGKRAQGVVPLWLDVHSRLHPTDTKDVWLAISENLCKYPPALHL
jgi:hypothetical protein